MRGYFLGVTIVAAWSALIVGVGARLLGVSLAGTIAVVTFLGGYVPYLGAWTAGIFAVLIALGGSSTETAAALAVIVLPANGCSSSSSSRLPTERRSACIHWRC